MFAQVQQAMRALIAPVLLALLIAPPAWSASAPAGAVLASENRAFAVDDYFRLRRVSELALSPDGHWLVYATEAWSLDENGSDRRITLLSLAKEGTPVVLDKLADAQDLAFIPKTQELAFLSSRSGTTQVHSLDVATGKIRQRTEALDPVVSFRFAPGGQDLAYVTRARTAPTPSLYERFRHGETGILIDTDTTSSHDFVNPDWHGATRPAPPVLWVKRATGLAARAPVPGDTDHYAWSPDSRSLSVTYKASDMPAAGLGDRQSSLGIFRLDAGTFRDLAEGSAAAGGKPGLSFAGGEWLADGSGLLVRRVREIDPWVSESFPDWAIVDPSQGIGANTIWHPAELYPAGLRFIPAGRTMLAETMVEGVRSLYELGPDGLRRSDLTAGLDGSSSLFQFSADFSRLAFVNESLTRPPEIFVRTRGAPARRLTNLNGELARRVRHGAREVSWKSSDGVLVKGWLLEPAASTPTRPWPLVTHVHGGPAFPFPNAFAPYFDYWPYPLEVYAARGIAVFLPNYRGTHSYGRTVAASTGDAAAIDDILTGVRSLVASGIADAERLGISGHSHGALVGPLAMARAKTFRAASFAEGVSNQVVMYELMSGDANRWIHDPTIGASLYEAPERYIEGSADLHIAGVPTAGLFEAGAKTAAIFMLGLPKAARRFGMPAEFVVYPRTGHNLTIPSLQREAAHRNLDWFEFWLNDRMDADPAKTEQYRRWQAMLAR